MVRSCAGTCPAILSKSDLPENCSSNRSRSVARSTRNFRGGGGWRGGFADGAAWVVLAGEPARRAADHSGEVAGEVGLVRIAELGGQVRERRRVSLPQPGGGVLQPPALQ